MAVEALRCMKSHVKEMLKDSQTRTVTVNIFLGSVVSSRSSFLFDGCFAVAFQVERHTVYELPNGYVLGDIQEFHNKEKYLPERADFWEGKIVPNGDWDEKKCLSCSCQSHLFFPRRSFTHALQMEESGLLLPNKKTSATSPSPTTTWTRPCPSPPCTSVSPSRKTGFIFLLGVLQQSHSC